MKLIAIGGGEIGRPGYPIETRKIDEEIIRLSGKIHPTLLFIPTASGDSESYYQLVENYFGKRLGCKTDVLYLIKEKPARSEIERKLSEVDIIYVGGGNTLRMLKAWRRCGVDKLLKKAAKDGKILCGVSAGAICWFRYGNSDAMRFGPRKSKRLVRLRGLNLINSMVCPHYNFEKNRRPSLRRMIQREGGLAIALENCSALEVINNKYRVITSSRRAKAYRLYRSNGKVIEETLPTDNTFRSLEQLFET